MLFLFTICSWNCRRLFIARWQFWRLYVRSGDPKTGKNLFRAPNPERIGGQYSHVWRMSNESKISAGMRCRSLTEDRKTRSAILM
jgi:hypothetical protein